MLRCEQVYVRATKKDNRSRAHILMILLHEQILFSFK